MGLFRISLAWRSEHPLDNCGDRYGTSLKTMVHSRDKTECHMQICRITKQQLRISLVNKI